MGKWLAESTILCSTKYLCKKSLDASEPSKGRGYLPIGPSDFSACLEDDGPGVRGVGDWLASPACPSLLILLSWREAGTLTDALCLTIHNA